MSDKLADMNVGNMDDTIRRQAAIAAIEEYLDRLQQLNREENPGIPYKVGALNRCANSIRDLPSAAEDYSEMKTRVSPNGIIRRCFTRMSRRTKENDDRLYIATCGIHAVDRKGLNMNDRISRQAADEKAASLTCPQCGAPIVDSECPYCGVRFYDFAYLRMFCDSYIRFRHEDLLATFKARLVNIEVKYGEPDCTAFADNRVLVEYVPPDDELTLTFKIVPVNGVRLTAQRATEKER